MVKYRDQRIPIYELDDQGRPRVYRKGKNKGKLIVLGYKENKRPIKPQPKRLHKAQLSNNPG